MAVIVSENFARQFLNIFLLVHRYFDSDTKVLSITAIVYLVKSRKWNRGSLRRRVPD